MRVNVIQFKSVFKANLGNVWECEFCRPWLHQRCVVRFPTFRLEQSCRNSMRMQALLASVVSTPHRWIVACRRGVASGIFVSTQDRVPLDLRVRQDLRGPQMRREMSETQRGPRRRRLLDEFL